MGTLTVRCVTVAQLLNFSGLSFLQMLVRVVTYGIGPL